VLPQIRRVTAVNVLALEIAQEVDGLEVRRNALGASEGNDHEARARSAQALQHSLKPRDTLLAAEIRDDFCG
jgi:hypothetical protein